MKLRKKIHIKGVVQGVGFRPFVYKNAKKYDLKGFVANDQSGVIIEVEGDEKAIDSFLKEIYTNCPGAAKIKELKCVDLPPKNLSSFVIRPSSIDGRKEAFVPPDIATCEECLKELFDQTNRRYRYPFTNCTNCGPRYSIIVDIPYDRPNTTMKEFVMCPCCDEEYHDPLNRRFHAQPNACPVCGPEIELLDSKGNRLELPDPICFVARELKKGKVLVLKGIGGFHLVCDAKNKEAIERIRKIKKRPEKPLAIMVPDIDFAKKLVYLSKTAEKLLTSCEAPIVLVERKKKKLISSLVAPNLNEIGVMLPYTPLHHILLNEFKGPLVMTSANPTGSPIVYKNSEALDLFKSKIDFFLIHNRKIHIRIDDSVVRDLDSFFSVVRRARGYAPLPFDLGFRSDKTILALGGMLKSTFTFLRDNKAVMSQYLGDLSEIKNLDFYLEVLNHIKKLYDFKPEVIVCDLHPDYPTTSLAEQLSREYRAKLIKVQHHIAHLASAAAEHKLKEAFLGVAFDGTGYGLDAKIWGGEFFLGNTSEFKRVAHIDYFPLPTGEKAIKEPWRVSFAFLFYLMKDRVFDEEWVKDRRKNYNLDDFIKVITGLRHPQTSSCGRLLDAISSLLNIKDKTTYEAQAAMELESMADKRENGFYEKPIKNKLNLDPYELIRLVIHEHKKGVSSKTISAKVHNTLAHWILNVARKMKETHGIKCVVLSGGVFQNKFLLLKTFELLKKENFEVFTNQLIPVNDEGISFGQAVIGALKE